MVLAFETPAHFLDQHTSKTPWLAIIKAIFMRQIAAEVFGMPGYRLTLTGAFTGGFLISPHEFRVPDPNLGKAILGGRFMLANAKISVQGSGDPWNRPSPNRAFALELHRFNWLSSLMKQPQGPQEALRLFLLWHKTFRTWTPFSWSEAVLPRRLINLSIFARRMTSSATHEDVKLLAKAMAEQGRHMLRLGRSLNIDATMSVALVVLGCVLDGKSGEGFLKIGLKRLSQALKRTILADGTHASRNPEQGLELLYDLLVVEDALSQRSLPVGEDSGVYKDLGLYIERLSRFIRTLCHPDGSLCAFQGAPSLPADAMAAAFVQDDHKLEGERQVPICLEHGRYHRLLGRSLTVIVDTGEARSGPLGLSACDHPMSFEVSGGYDKLIVGPGWSAQHADRQALRIIGAANCLTLGEGPILNPITGRFGETLQYALSGIRYRVRHRRVEAENAASLLEMEHEGWRPKYGLKHERRLYIDPQADELRGEDRLVPVEPKPDMPVGVPFCVRFLLHPDVKATLARDKKSLLLKTPGGRGWWLRHDSREVILENGHVFDKGVMRKTHTIALKGVARLDGPTRVRWKLSPAEA
jgi:uncharacterized heparinase superfamily protein